MSGKNNNTPRVDNPGEEDEGGPATGKSASGAPENPDSDAAGLEALSQEAEQQAVFAEAGVSDDLLALRDAIEARLLSASGESRAQSDGSSSEGIVGVGIGLPDPTNVTFGAGGPGEPVLTIFTESAMPQEAVLGQVAQAAGTRSLSSVPVQQVPVGVVDAYSHRARHRPAPGGVSVGHVNVTAGTLGSRAIGLTAPWNNRHLILSNNHVLANSNAASVNDSIIQPGSADGGRHPGDQIAVLARWVPINFGGAANFVDCAFGWAWHDRIRGEQYYLSGGSAAYYRTGTAALAASLGLIVGKSGRTTGLTQGRVTQIGVSVNVNFGGGRVALFRNQIAIQSVNANPFSAGGDSGSLIWHWASGVRPVGLLFAGGGGTTFANPIASVLSALNIRLLP
ncbi:hypothetical protein [Achromobacter arsenitoxydans]|uniref:hypothetical protein n=1 Tax=Achromobacter arsenitoxydans TaxID=1147684 RepID=UPI000318D64E|nr:hypothetical protein [Achromobacter arsenitoxydans]